jgi:proteasome lid subunit RPN8/RPN11
MPELFPAASVAAMAHAESEYPNECVGVITLDGEYVPLKNVSQSPADSFALSEEDDFEYATSDEDGNPKVSAIIHSECYEKGEVNADLIGPSREDMQQQMATGCTWGLVPCIGGFAEKPIYWGDFILDTPLLHRPFVPQVTDCCSAIQSFYWQIYGIKLHECPRDWNWWRNGGDLYEDNFRLAGFHEISLDEAMPGDVVLAQIRSPVPNHAVIILDAGLMYHHPQQMLSRREPVGRWRHYAVKALRHGSFDGPPPPPPVKLSSLYGDENE